MVGPPRRISSRKFPGRTLPPGNSFTGTVRTLTLNVKVKFVPNDKESENAPDYRIQAGGNYEFVQGLSLNFGALRSWIR